ncbi:MAG TPA: nucleotidyltransferase family protein [Methylomirabilota bacterium]|nr:nucleotidyltransferase family protein [Methylomirabilota bacterium]
MQRLWQPPQLLLLLQAVSQGRTDAPLEAFDEAHIRWAIDTGLGPLLYRATRDDPRARTSPLWPLLRGADLTARVLAEEQREALGEILTACDGRVSPLVLLKGISISDQHYPEPHLRPMRDLDLLVEEQALPALASLLRQLGYQQPYAHRRPPDQCYRHHHDSPFFHPHRGLWIEAHWRLFSSLSMFENDKVFRLGQLHAQFTPSSFQDRAVTRLSNEVQLLYIAAHWSRDYNALDVVGSVFALVDMLFLLRNTGEALRWECILDWTQDSATAVPLYLLLTYLVKHRLIKVEPAILRTLALRQRTFGVVNLALMHALIDRYVVDGRPLGRLLNARNLPILWDTLLLPGPPFRNLMLIPWRLLPSWVGVKNQLAKLKTSAGRKPEAV